MAARFPRMHMMMPDDPIIAATRRWIEKAVIGLNLCPFAKGVYVKKQIRYTVSPARDTAALLDDLVGALHLLQESDPEQVDTALLIHPHVLNDFLEYNEFLGVADATVDALGLRGEIQIASFHPDYQFAGTGKDDIENFTNRSPYPLLHLLREASIERAVEAFPQAEDIFRQNMETLRRLGHAGWAQLDAGKAKGF